MNTKKKSLLILFLSTLFFLYKSVCFSQDTTKLYVENVYPYYQSGEKYYERNRNVFPSRPGPFIIYTKEKYLDTLIQFKWLQGQLAPGGMTGKWIEWHINGQKCWEASFLKSKHMDTEYFYSPGGSITNENEWVNGLLRTKYEKERKRSEKGFYISRTLYGDDSTLVQRDFNESNDTLRVIQMALDKNKKWHTKDIHYKNNSPATINNSDSKNTTIIQPNSTHKFSIWDDEKINYQSKVDTISTIDRLEMIYLFSLNKNETPIINALSKKMELLDSYKHVKTIVLKSESKKLKEIPEFIFKCDSLQELEITADIEFIPEKIARLTRLNSLKINSANGIDLKEAIKVLAKLQNLHALTIVNTKEHDIPHEISQLKNLVILELDNSKRDENGNLYPPPTEIYELKQLNSINIPQELINVRMFYSNIPDCLYLYTKPKEKAH